MTEFLLDLLKLSVVVMIVAIGMSSSLSDLAYIWRRPSLLVRSFLAMYVLVPLAALLIVRTLPLAPPVQAALLVLAASGGAPLLPRKLIGLVKGAYIFSLVVSSSVAAILLVPAWIALLARYFDGTAEISYLSVALVVAKAFLAPLAIGMVIRAAVPAWAERQAGRILAIGMAVLIAGVLALLAVSWELFLNVRPIGIAALAALMLFALAIGHALGGPDPNDRTALAVACSTRHIGIAVLLASSFPGSRAIVLVIVYILTSLVITFPYLRWRKGREAAPAA